MPSTRAPRVFAFALMALLSFSYFCPRGHAQAALLMEEPYGFFGTMNPTGHTAFILTASAPRRPSNCADAAREKWVRLSPAMRACPAMTGLRSRSSPISIQSRTHPKFPSTWTARS